MADNLDARKKILLVDDDEIHLSTAELFLKDKYQIHKAMSGDEALECLRTNQISPDLIMLDIIMPNMDGWEVFRRIKAIALLKDVPVIFLTSVDEEKNRKKARELGAADYITKPYNMILLKNAIKEVLDRKVTRRR